MCNYCYEAYPQCPFDSWANKMVYSSPGYATRPGYSVSRTVRRPKPYTTFFQAGKRS